MSQRGVERTSYVPQDEREAVPIHLGRQGLELARSRRCGALTLPDGRADRAAPWNYVPRPFPAGSEASRRAAADRAAAPLPEGDPMSSHNSTLTALQRSDGLDDFANREILRGLVQKQICCPETGRVLDIRNAVAVEVTETATGRCVHLQVTTTADADAYDDVFAERAASCAAQVQGTAVTVYDGRILFGRNR